jgi:transcriptional regulator with GAF, ATPase, and Fis domain
MWIRRCNTCSAIFPIVFSALEEVGLAPHSWEERTSTESGVCILCEWHPAYAHWIQSESCHAPIYVVIEGNPTVLPWAAWQALRSGAQDVYIWNGCAESIVSGIAASLRRMEEIEALMASSQIIGGCVGCSSVWKGFLRRIVEAARFSNSPVLLLGESGTGKEMVAHIVHELGIFKKDRPMITLDCSSISKELSGSEFFGHVRGAFTGAVSDRDGAFALADGGTLFLDEIGELPLSLQAELLRVLQEGTFKPVGSNIWQRSSFRLVSATNRDLRNDVAAGHFRSDLYHRLASGSIFHLPALRERREDIGHLARHFLAGIATSAVPHLSNELEKYLIERDYSGNIRELKAVIGRMFMRYPGAGPMTLGLIPPEEREEITGHIEQETIESNLGNRNTEDVEQAVRNGLSLKEIGRHAEETAIQVALRLESGSIRRAAKRLQISDRALQLRVASLRGSLTLPEAKPSMIPNG